MLDAFAARKLQLVETLADLRGLAESAGAETLANQLQRELVDKLEEDRFHLVVVGEFNHGKTALVNALLGREVLPVGVTPTTTAIHHLVYASTPGVRIVRGSDDEEQIPFERLQDYAAGGACSREPVRYLEVQYPAQLLRDRIVLVDTPGVNDLSLTRAEITFGYLPRADAVLFVLDAGQPVKESEREFLQKQLLERSRDRIVFVVNKADIWSEAEREEALTFVRERLAGLVDRPAVFAVSATAALAGEQAASGLPEFVDHVTRMLAQDRGRILLRNAVSEGLAAAQAIGRGLDAQRRALELSSEQLAERIATLERDLEGHASTVEERRLMVQKEAAAIQAWARRDLDGFVQDTLRRLPKLLEQTPGADVKQHLGAFLEHSFVTWAQAETQEVSAALEGVAERIAALLREDAREACDRMGQAFGGQLRTPAIQVDTFAYDIGVFALLSLGLGVFFANALLGGLLLAAAPALALYTRDRTDARIRQRAQEVAELGLREAAERVGPQLDEMVEDFRARLDAWVMATGQQLHRELIEVLQRVKKQRDEAQPDLQSQRSRSQQDSEQLDRIVARLLKMQAGRSAVRGSDQDEQAPGGLL